MDVILILGAAVWADGASPTLRRRTMHAAMLWHEGVAPHIIVCGGLGVHPPTEAEAMRDILVANNVPDSAITQEGHSTSTLENIRFALPHLKQRRARSVLIVTDKTHGPRAAMVARHFGLTVKVSSPPLRSSHKRAFLRQVLRESGAIPLYAWRLRKVPRDPD